MQITQPLVFEPLFMERVWGGRHLESLFHKNLPSGARIGESWELVDREEAQSVVHSGPLQGSTLHDLWTEHRAAIFGEVPDAPRFPLLLKLLDARERLSVQVHPPASVAGELRGEPKTEMWYIADANPEGDIFAGLRQGVDRAEFEQALKSGDLAGKLHRIDVKAGDAIFIPSGRVHAIGAGTVIVEVQQNSDTTYRVFDWNRSGLDGKPRQLHIEESLRSIDFNDAEPSLQPKGSETVVDCELFNVEKWTLTAPRAACGAAQSAIITCLEGEVDCAGARFSPGDFFLVAACQADKLLTSGAKPASLLRTTIPS